MAQRLKNHKWLTGYIILVVLLAFIPLVFQSPYYLHIFIISLVNAMLGMTFLMLFRTGLISLGIATFWGIGAYASTVFVKYFGLSFWLSLPAATITTAIIALLIGFVLIGSGSSGLSFVILSSIVGMVFVVAVGNIPYLGAYNGITGIPKPDPIVIPGLVTIDFTSKASLFYLALVIFIIVTLAFAALYASSIGRAWGAIGLNKKLALSIGVDITKYRLLAFVLSSALAGLVGSYFAHYTGFIVPDVFNMFVNVYIQIYAILGGIGYIIMGPLLGSILMTFIPETMRMAQQMSYLIVGVFLVILVMFLPKGLLGLVEPGGILHRLITRINMVISARFRRNTT